MATARAPKAGARRAGTKKKEKKNVPHGVASIAATFNNTIVAISDPMGNILAWSSAGRIGFKGSRKGTPFAAQVAAQNAAQLAQEHGVRRDRKSTRLNSSHVAISYAVFCLKKKKKQYN